MPSRRQAGIDGLRAIAAMSVLVHHVYAFGRTDGRHLDLPGPGIEVFRDLRWGLLLFFALSGYLLYRPFAAAILGGRPLPDVPTFLRNRALRIAPAYWVVLLVTAVVLAVATLPDLGIGRLTEPEVLLADLVLVQNLNPDWVFTGISPAWTLAVEAVFYLVLPVLAIGAAMLAARGMSPRHAVLVGPLVLFALGMAGKGAIAAGLLADGTWEAVQRTAFVTQADLFAYGMAVAVIAVLATEGHVTLPRRTPLLAAIAAVILVALAATDAASNAGAHGRFADAVVGLACALLLVAIVAPAAHPNAGVRLLETAPLRWVGTISYSVYLWHVPVILWLGARGHTAGNGWELLPLMAAALVLTLSLSALTYRFVEAPALARKRSTTPRPAEMPVVAATSTASIRR